MTSTIRPTPEHASNRSNFKATATDITALQARATLLETNDAATGAIAHHVTFAAAAAASNVCEVTITVKSYANATVSGVHHLDVYLSDADTGAGLTATDASGTVAAKSASGVDLKVLVAKKAIRVQTLATGVYILEITDSAKTAFYPCAVVGLTGKATVGTVLGSGDYGA